MFLLLCTAKQVEVCWLKDNTFVKNETLRKRTRRNVVEECATGTRGDMGCGVYGDTARIHAAAHELRPKTP